MIMKKTPAAAAKFLLFVAASSLAVAGCARIRDNQGYIVDQQLVSNIAPGVDNKESVERTLGRPTFESKWNDDIWYYVSRNTEQLAFMPPNATSQQVMVVTFDEAGNVADIENREGFDQVAYFSPEEDETPVYGRDSSLFQEIFGNIGRVSSIPAGAPPQ